MRPLGLREGNVLFMLDRQNPNFKKYRLPAPLNLRYTYENYIEDLRKYGGEESEDFSHLVLGQHGSPTYSLIPYESITHEPYDFFSYRFTGDDIQHSKQYKEKLGLPQIDEKHRRRTVLAIDTGYTDPTIIQVFCQDTHNIWRVHVRYRLTRVPFPEQANIIDWIATHYNVDHICIDAGSGGSGVAIIQDLMTDRFARHKHYRKIVSGHHFNETIIADSGSGDSIKVAAKASGAQLLARMIEDKSLRFSELDMEGVSQLSRVAPHRLTSGAQRYFVMSDRGGGESKDDHIFASFIVFMIALQTTLVSKRHTKKRLAMRWG